MIVTDITVNITINIYKQIIQLRPSLAMYSSETLPKLCKFYLIFEGFYNIYYN